MTASPMLDKYLEYELKKAEDANTIRNATLAIKNEFVASYPPQKMDEEFSLEEYNKVLSLTTLSVKMYANSYYKSNPYLDSKDIDQIKKALNGYTSDKQKIKEFKKSLIDDLTAFQKQINENHVKKLVDLTKQKRLLERDVQILDFEKNKLIMDRLSKIVWPYDAKTKEYDNKIAAAQSKIEYYAQKIADIESLRPMANEKDILLYQLKLKEKYALNK